MISARMLNAESEAKRFLRSVAVAKKLLVGKDGRIEGKEVAAVKRASMDLTRALAEMRRAQE